MVEEALLQTHAVVGIELGPVLQTVDLEPLLRRGSLDETLDVAAKVSAGSTPVARRQEGHRDPVEVRGAHSVEVVEERMGANVCPVVRAVRLQLVVGERLGAGHEVPGLPADETALAEAVLHGGDRPPVPRVDRLAQQAPVIEHVAIEVAHPFPRDHRREMRWLQTRDQPLCDRVVADAEQTDLPVAPWLRSGPLDAVVEIFRPADRIGLDMPWRATPASRIDANTDVSARNPSLRVADLPRLIAVRRPSGDLGMILDQRAPGVGVPILEVEPLAIWAVADQRRVAIVIVRAIDVGTQAETVVHLDRHVPTDGHGKVAMCGHPSSCIAEDRGFRP